MANNVKLITPLNKKKIKIIREKTNKKQTNKTYKEIQ